jgi:serine/threonine protein kinase
MKNIGKGNFGNVFLCVNKENRNLYALKTIKRDKITRFKLEDSLILERTILLGLDHTFIIKLIKTFKDD